MSNPNKNSLTANRPDRAIVRFRRFLHKKISIWIASRRLRHAAKTKPCRIVIGAGLYCPPNWLPSQIDYLNMQPLLGEENIKGKLVFLIMQNIPKCLSD